MADLPTIIDGLESPNADNRATVWALLEGLVGNPDYYPTLCELDAYFKKQFLAGAPKYRFKIGEFHFGSYQEIHDAAALVRRICPN